MKKRDYCNGSSIDGNCGVKDCAIIQNGSCGPILEHFSESVGLPEDWAEMKQKLFGSKRK